MRLTNPLTHDGRLKARGRDAEDAAAEGRSFACVQTSVGGRSDARKKSLSSGQTHSDAMPAELSSGFLGRIFFNRTHHTVSCSSKTTIPSGKNTFLTEFDRFSRMTDSVAQAHRGGFGFCQRRRISSRPACRCSRSHPIRNRGTSSAQARTSRSTADFHLLVERELVLRRQPFLLDHRIELAFFTPSFSASAYHFSISLTRSSTDCNGSIRVSVPISLPPEIDTGDSSN
jgi:hypothetical protein